MIKNWNAAALRKDILDKVEQNAPAVGKFLENSAKGYLYNISDPEWGKNYRNKIVARLVASEVERLPNEVVIRIGVKTGPGGQHHGFYIEMGSSTAPPHPFIRPAGFNNMKRITKTLIGE